MRKARLNTDAMVIRGKAMVRRVLAKTPANRSGDMPANAAARTLASQQAVPGDDSHGNRYTAAYAVGAGTTGGMRRTWPSSAGQATSGVVWSSSPRMAGNPQSSTQRSEERRVGKERRSRWS